MEYTIEISLPITDEQLAQFQTAFLREVEEDFENFIFNRRNTASEKPGK